MGCEQPISITILFANKHFITVEYSFLSLYLKELHCCYKKRFTPVGNVIKLRDLPIDEY